MINALLNNFTTQERQPDHLKGDVDDRSTPMVLVMDDVQQPTSKVQVIPINDVSKTSITFNKPIALMAKHLKPLYVKAHFNGIPVSKVLVDNGASINILPSQMM